MRKGILIIKQQDGKWSASVKRADGEEIPLPGFRKPEAFRDKNGQSCWYLKRKSQLIVKLGNKEIYNNSDFSKQGGQTKKKEKKLSADQALRKQQKENPALNIPEPELTPVPDCPERRKLPGKNLYDLNPQALRLAEDTINTLQGLKQNNKVYIDNFGLALNKAVHFLKLGKKNKPEYNHFENGNADAFLYRSTFDDKSGNNKIKRKFEIDFSFNTPSSQDIIKSLNERQQRVLTDREKQGWHTQKSCFKIDNRLVAGLGGASVFETSMTLHHVYGIPYLPGSSIKGLVRSWIIMNCFLPDQKDTKEGERGKAAEKAAMKNTLFAHIFGTDTNGPDKKAHQGKVIFFDAYPKTPPVIEADVMNVHYPKYYSKGEVPADYDSPNPIPFLTVGKCDVNNEPLAFCFRLAMKENPVVKENSATEQAHIDKLCKRNSDWRKGINEGSTILDVVNYWLHSALTHHGIGAKTAVGYGYFK